MHRFWEAAYPSDYEELIHDQKWINRYKNEISISMKSTCKYINKLTDFIEKNSEYELWIISSMGQQAIENISLKVNWPISNLEVFIQNIVGEKLTIKTGPSMVPLYSISSNKDNINKIERSLNMILTNVSIKLRTKTTNTLSFYFYSNEDNIFFKKGNKKIGLDGLCLKEIKENSSSSAYHVPEGLFFRYGKDLQEIDSTYLSNGFLHTDLIKDIVIETLS